MADLRTVFLAGVGVWAVAVGAAAAQDKHDKGGMFLTNKQGELCTMCEADAVCTPTPVEGEATPPAKTTLHFQKRGFFGQMSTVLDYFPLTRKFGMYHSRDVDVKTGEGAATQRLSARFDLETKRIDFQDGAGKTLWWIDRNDASWRNADGSVRGTCTASAI